MTEPTRDALHAETLAVLANIRPANLPNDVAACFDHAAECVKRVPELEAEVEEFRKQTAFYRLQAEEFWAEVARLRAKAAEIETSLRGAIMCGAMMLAKMGGTATFSKAEQEAVFGRMTRTDSPDGSFTIAYDAAYAAATREGTD